MVFVYDFATDLGYSCRILRDPIVRTVGVTPTEANETDGLAVVTYDNVGHPHKRERIVYTSEDEEENQLDAFMLVDRNDMTDLLRQAETHVGRGGFKSTTIACVKSNCSTPNAAIFLLLWAQTMCYVVVSCMDSHFIYNPFTEEVLPLKQVRMNFLRGQFDRIWSDMKRTVIKVTAIQENLNFIGRRPLLGSCFLFSLIFSSYVQAMIFKIVRMKPPVEFPSEDLVYKFVHVMKGDPYNGSFTVVRKKEYTLSAKQGLIKSQDYSIKCPGYTRHFAYLLNYGTALEPHINRFVRSVFEAGLPEAWFAMTLNARRQYIEHDEPVKRLDIVDFEVAFFELLIGLSLSTFVFIWEILSSKIVYVG
ncbi:hypothetical protein GE061_012075 [Apolygus lucorum]|uniref:Uncharacterized protein n=1 Tax=Apolygus lucorum TaxID=248454 RepID=A0A8S9XR68_APOLU|nr:hypothetical protein GE061_012075 [Apolygus lucorum]